MNFKLELKMDDAEQEAVYLNDFISAHDMEGVETEVLETEALEGTMGGLGLAAILALAVNEGVKKTIGKIIDLIFKQFDGKRAAFELTGECPDTGKKFVLKFDNTSMKKRAEIIEEFNVMHETICGTA